jgi:hypothetical protein
LGTRQIRGILYAKASVPRLLFWRKMLRSAVFPTISANRAHSKRRRTKTSCLPLFRQGSPNAQTHWKIGHYLVGILPLAYKIPQGPVP